MSNNLSDNLMEDFEKAAKEKGSFIVIGIPIGINMQADVRLQLWASAMCQRDNIVVKYEASRFAQEGMNKIIHYFLNYIKPATHLFLLNCDEYPLEHPNECIDMMLALDKDIVVGAVPIIYQDICWKCNHWKEGKANEPFVPLPYDRLPKEPFRTFDAGGPFLIKRKVLEEMEWPYFFNIWTKDTSEFVMSDDLFFSRKALEHNFEIWCEPRAVWEHFKHVGLKRVADLARGDYDLSWGGYSVSATDWDFILNIVKTEKVKTALEFGAGLSSLLLSEFKVDVDTFETLKAYGDKVLAKDTFGNLKMFFWDGKSCKPRRKHYDLAFVDGPHRKLGRGDALRIAIEHSDRIIVHDADREHEVQLQEEYLRKDFDLKEFKGRCNYWVRKK